MARYEPIDPGYAERIRASFERQRVMALIGAELTRVEPGLVEIELAYRSDLVQQHGYVHAGITTTIADSAGGYAAYSLMPADSSILAVEFKINLVAPARGERFIAQGRVVRPGSRLTVCELEVFAQENGERRTCLVGLQTTMCLPGTSDAPPA